MADRPILFSAPMVRAILAGMKTQTRRVVKLAPADLETLLHRVKNRDVCCPYGKPGDRLWVRETFVQGWPLVDGVPDQFDEDDNEKPIHTWYRATSPNLTWADEDGGHSDRTPWRPSIHMPRTASRITLEITGIRVEQLQAISEADASAEGITHRTMNDPRVEYQHLWEDINGADSWDSNPWVWVVEFKRLEAQ